MVLPQNKGETRAWIFKLVQPFHHPLLRPAPVFPVSSNNFQATSRGHNPMPLALSSFSSELTKLDPCWGPTIFILIQRDSCPGLLGRVMRPVCTRSGGPVGFSAQPVCTRGFIYRSVTVSPPTHWRLPVRLPSPGTLGGAHRGGGAVQRDRF